MRLLKNQLSATYLLLQSFFSRALLTLQKKMRADDSKTRMRRVESVEIIISPINPPLLYVSLLHISKGTAGAALNQTPPETPIVKHQVAG